MQSTMLAFTRTTLYADFAPTYTDASHARREIHIQAVLCRHDPSGTPSESADLLSEPPDERSTVSSLIS